MPLTPQDTEEASAEDLIETEADAAIELIRQHPIRALLVATAVGFVIGKLIF